MDSMESREQELVVRGYYPGVIGKITDLHAVYYHEHWGFDQSFEIQVAKELSEFVKSFDPSRDGLWTAMSDGAFAGSVAVDGSRWSDDGARLRWFILEPEHQGKGIGGRLLAEAVLFCRMKGFGRIFLWTFEGLDVARHLYEEAGFRLTQEHEVDQWGGRIREQRFDMALPGGYKKKAGSG
ncbi:MAG: GNAT family N-acetyltransferase [Deltaproteobacteria bacterium CG_4_9_14_3_um_filter_51_14]|nr:MAG: GNAT family N-acetyltransferase [Deltaproteobacteria bacterium CG_4_9_14_3_um_filter_51_14]